MGKNCTWTVKAFSMVEMVVAMGLGSIILMVVMASMQFHAKRTKNFEDIHMAFMDYTSPVNKFRQEVMFATEVSGDENKMSFISIDAKSLTKETVTYANEEREVPGGKRERVLVRKLEGGTSEVVFYGNELHWCYNKDGSFLGDCSNVSIEAPMSSSDRRLLVEFVVKPNDERVPLVINLPNMDVDTVSTFNDVILMQ